MRPWEYVRSHAASLALAITGIASACLVAAVCGCPPDAVCLIAAVLVCATTAAGAVAFLRSRRFYNNLHDLAKQLERPWQLHALVDEPSQPDHLLVHDALRRMGSVCAQEVAQANERADEHRTFVEAWVHGIKAPLAASVLIAERVADPERAQLRLELDKIERQVQMVLWQARTDCANADYAIREVSLDELARSVCRANARFLIEHDCTPALLVDQTATVLTDPKQAGFVLTQLVENAAKYGARHIRLATERVGTQASAGAIVLRVEDDGLGIPAADVGRVFERGFTGTRGREGATSTGMGLYLAARLCEQLGLGLSITSEEGTGTCASLTFPLDRRRLDAASASREHLWATHLSTEHLRVREEEPPEEGDNTVRLP